MSVDLNPDAGGASDASTPSQDDEIAALEARIAELRAQAATPVSDPAKEARIAELKAELAELEGSAPYQEV